MLDKNKRLGNADDLRRSAEAMVRGNAAKNPEALFPDQLHELIHELRVHQIELEMQNDELRRAQTELEVSRARYFDLYDLAPVGYLTISDKGLILEANLTAACLFGVDRSDLVKQPLTRFIFPEDQDIYYQHRKQLLKAKKPRKCQLRMVNRDGELFWVSITDVLGDPGDKAATSKVIMSDMTGQKQLECERDRLIRDLQKAMSEIKTLKGIIPICAGCKKIRNDKGSWDAAEKYFMAHSDVQFSHGLCEECVKKHYPEHSEKILKEMGKDNNISF